MLYLHGKSSNENGSGSLIRISNGLPWHLHLITNCHVIPNTETARRMRAQFRSEGGEVESYDLEPDAYFVTNEQLDFTVVALSYNASTSLKNKNYFELTFSDFEPETGSPLGYYTVLYVSFIHFHSDGI